jgi:vacuolar-type H+-ATPase subunit I/STV1
VFESLSLSIISLLGIGDLESWSFAATIWGGFGTLALIPMIQLVRKHRTDGLKKKDEAEISRMRTVASEAVNKILGKINLLETDVLATKTRVDRLCQNMTALQTQAVHNENQMEKLTNKFNAIYTDVKILEAITDKRQSLENLKNMQHLPFPLFDDQQSPPRPVELSKSDNSEEEPV